jgi:(p)ppGpp synthase/HD superfamily hydrolase
MLADPYNQDMKPYSPFLTWRFDLALQFASGLHHQQVRKGTAIPYIAHLMSVCSLILEAGGDEDQAIAALLHDAVEDQGGLATLDTIRHLFGKRVADAVESCSDSTSTDSSKKPGWSHRKEKYLAHLRSTKNEDASVSSSSKVANLLVPARQKVPSPTILPNSTFSEPQLLRAATSRCSSNERRPNSTVGLLCTRRNA